MSAPAATGLTNHTTRRYVLAGLAFAEALGAVPADLTALKRWQERVAVLPSVKNRSGQTFLPEDLKRMGY